MPQTCIVPPATLLTRVVYLLQLMNLHHCHHPKSIVYSRVHSWCCTFHEFGQIIMTSIYHYSITQSIFQCPKNPIYPFPHPQPLATTKLISRSMDLPIMNIFISGIIDSWCIQDFTTRKKYDAWTSQGCSGQLCTAEFRWGHLCSAQSISRPVFSSALLRYNWHGILYKSQVHT